MNNNKHPIINADTKTVKKISSLKVAILWYITILLILLNDVMWFLRRGYPDIIIGRNRRGLAVRYNFYQNVFNVLGIDVGVLKNNDFLLFTVGPILRCLIVVVIIYTLWSIYNSTFAERNKHKALK